MSKINFLKELPLYEITENVFNFLSIPWWFLTTSHFISTAKNVLMKLSWHLHVHQYHLIGKLSLTWFSPCGRGVTRYKRSYGDVPPALVAKSASWYMNTKNECKKLKWKNGIWIDQVFKFSQIEPKLEKTQDFAQNLAQNWSVRCKNGLLFLDKIGICTVLLSNSVAAHPYVVWLIDCQLRLSLVPSWWCWFPSTAFDNPWKSLSFVVLPVCVCLEMFL